MAKTSKEYAEILESVLRIQIGYIRSNPNYEDDDYLQGQEVGLLTAIDKIKASKFLTE